MEESIRNFAKQFTWEPEIGNYDKLKNTDKFIVCGMGGSNLAAGLLKIARPKLDLLIHRDYCLPRVPDYFLNSSLLVFSSYSGNTEETLDAYNEARKNGLNAAVISSGGELLKLAKQEGSPYVELPATRIQPRMAVGYSLQALLKLIGSKDALSELSTLAGRLNVGRLENVGKELARSLSGIIPLVYASAINLPLAYNWKIKFNETGKIPAFYNVFPELNHNEMTGFDQAGQGLTAQKKVAERKWLNEKFSAVILQDDADHPRIRKRIDVMKNLYEARGISTQIITLSGDMVWEKIFNSLLMADWTAFYIAKYYGLEAEDVPMVEEFKKALI